jgi:hypothetical protein
MAYSRGMPEAKHLRQRFSHVASLAELDDIAAENMVGAHHAIEDGNRAIHGAAAAI